VDEVLKQFGEQQVAGFMLVLARVGPLFVLAPLFSSRLVPMRVKGIVAVALAVGLAPVMTKGVHIETNAFDLGFLIGRSC
jgi:flagellar biosynthetic protein FliR